MYLSSSMAPARRRGGAGGGPGAPSAGTSRQRLGR